MYTFRILIMASVVGPAEDCCVAAGARMPPAPELRTRPGRRDGARPTRPALCRQLATAPAGQPRGARSPVNPIAAAVRIVCT
jgi:hypothetical protein